MDAIDEQAEHAELLSRALLTKENIAAIYRVKNGGGVDVERPVVDELEDENVVKRVDGSVELTEKGEIFYPIVHQLMDKSFLDKLDWLIDRAEDWEETLPPFHLLQDASVRVEQSQECTREVVDRYNELAGESATLQELSPFILGAGIESREAVLPTDTDCRYIFSEGMIEDINDSERHRKALQKYKEDPHVDLLRYPGEFPYMLTCLDDTTLLITRGEEYMTVLIESQGEGLRMWAENKIAEYRAQSQELQVDRGVEPPEIQK
ncbi:transcriptional regulator FilR1 domain-containing protein [Halovenus sp. HT40]|uniref:transcriptional regulator FilR1 domain-containing protein n=1 Tax=Halovenus sp. HT40 TaxID=3126691 RepID=UPI00300ED386